MWFIIYFMWVTSFWPTIIWCRVIRPCRFILSIDIYFKSEINLNFVRFCFHAAIFEIDWKFRSMSVIWSKLNIPYRYIENSNSQIPLISIWNMIQTDNNTELNIHLQIDIVCGFSSLCCCWIWYSFWISPESRFDCFFWSLFQSNRGTSWRNVSKCAHFAPNRTFSFLLGAINFHFFFSDLIPLFQ